MQQCQGTRLPSCPQDSHFKPKPVSVALLCATVLQVRNEAISDDWNEEEESCFWALKWKLWNSSTAVQKLYLLLGPWTPFHPENRQWAPRTCYFPPRCLTVCQVPWYPPRRTVHCPTNLQHGKRHHRCVFPGISGAQIMLEGRCQTRYSPSFRDHKVLLFVLQGRNIKAILEALTSS